MPVSVDQFLNAALDRDIEASVATRECRTYFDLLRDREFFQRTLAQRERTCRGQTQNDQPFLKTKAALTEVEIRLQTIEQAYGLKTD